ncbi:hypothetical protein RHGRI_002776 [Rhododendron griersonianum]|uniref:Thioredoxin-like protein 4B n=1 Tax=Rhododendron griersonianum TaxID=479676 RepID=A0AAV6LQR6_9ERIC|nr:hypothetical protein RHGRI_002776 [Rhododendron griersonianum]KAG5567322.1 hypothetical protein RHGRI_002776 [Rhododendron griersonianum]
MSLMLTTLTKKREVDSIIRDTIDKVLVLRFGRSSDPISLQLDDIISKSAREVSKFATVALVDIDSEEIQVYVKFFDITFIPSTVFFFNAHHMKMDSGYSFFLSARVQITPSGLVHFTENRTLLMLWRYAATDFLEAIYRGAMKGKLIVSCPLPPERIPKFQLLYKDV